MGYQFFAEKGPQQFSIKALAEQCQLPRTNFYYHFNDKDDLIDKIIEVHFTTTTELFNEELRTRFHTYIPDLYVILYDFKLGLQFAKQDKSNIEVVWLDLANAYGSVPHTIIDYALEHYWVPEKLRSIIELYYKKFKMRFTT